jgi:hypothetical protein
MAKDAAHALLASNKIEKLPLVDGAGRLNPQPVRYQPVNMIRHRR